MADPAEGLGRKAGSAGTGPVLATFSRNGFMAGGQWEGNHEALLVLVALRGARCVGAVIVLTPSCLVCSAWGHPSAFHQPWGWGRRPPSSLGPSFPQSRSHSWKPLCWGWKRKGRLGLECGPGYHLYPPLPGLKASPKQVKSFSDIPSLCLFVGGGRWKGPTQSPSSFSSLPPSAGWQRRTEELQASCPGPWVCPASFTSSQCAVCTVEWGWDFCSRYC